MCLVFGTFMCRVNLQFCIVTVCFEAGFLIRLASILCLKIYFYVVITCRTLVWFRPV